jgi:quinol monooxygenase YgiN
MFLSLIKIYPLPGHDHNVLEVLDSMKGPVTALVDCLDCIVAVEWGEGGAICYIELWRSREALARQLRSPLFGRVLEAMELSHKPPLIDFLEVNSIGGMELMENLCIPKPNRNENRPDLEVHDMISTFLSKKGRNRNRRTK